MAGINGHCYAGGAILALACDERLMAEGDVQFALNEVNGHRSCTLVNLAKIAVQTGRVLRFNPRKQRFIDDDQANALIKQPMRGPWKI